MVPLSQAPVAGNPAAPAPASPAAPVESPAVPVAGDLAPKSPPAPDLGVAEMLKLRARLQELEAKEAERAREAAAKAERDILEQGRSEKVQEYYQAELAKRDKALTEYQARVMRAERQRVIAGALTGVPLSYPEAASDLQQLWAEDFEVTDGPDGPRVLCKQSLRPAADVIAERLASPRYGHFLKAPSQGGVGPGGNNAAPTANPAQAAPRSYEEQIMAAWANRQNAQADGPVWQRDFRANLRRN